MSPNPEWQWQPKPEESLSDFAVRFTAELCQHAKQGDSKAISAAWHCANKTTQAIHYIAREQPEHLKRFAGPAFFFPSFIAKPDVLNHGFVKLAESAGFGDTCLLKLKDSTRFNLDDPATRYVIEFINDVCEKRAFLLLSTIPNIFGPDISKLRDISPELAAYFGSSPREKDRIEAVELLEKRKTPTNKPMVMVFDSVQELDYRDLKPLGPKTAQEWWEKALRPHLERPETLAELKGTQLWEKAIARLATPSARPPKQHFGKRASEYPLQLQNAALVEIREDCRRKLIQIANHGED